MCKLLHCISPKIVACILELIDFYVYAVHEIFGKDAVNIFITITFEDILIVDICSR